MDADDGSRATPPLDAAAAAFKSQVMELQDLVLARSMFPATALPELANVDALVTAMESQVETIRRRLQEELDAIPKAKKLVQRSLKEEEKLQHIHANLPSGMRKDAFATQLEQSSSRMLPRFDSSFTEANECDVKIKDEPVAAPRKGRAPAPRWYISSEELDSLSSYMRGRLTLEKVNIAINEVASYAEANAHLVTCPKKKLSEDTWDKALDEVLCSEGHPGTWIQSTGGGDCISILLSTDSELRDIAAKEAVKGNHFFLEADIKGPGLKLDNTGKAILTRYLDERDVSQNS